NAGREQLAEIALLHARAGNASQVGLLDAPLSPFLCPGEEYLAASGVEDVRNVDRAAEVVAELVKLERRHSISRRVAIARPRIGIERGVTEILVGRPVEGVGAALGDDADLAARGAPVFGAIGGGQDLNLGRLVKVGGTDGSSIGACADAHRA